MLGSVLGPWIAAASDILCLACRRDTSGAVSDSSAGLLLCLTSTPVDSNPHLPPAPRQGRATLEAKVHVAETPSGPQDVVMTIVLDGYNAPVSAGNFADLVLRKFYDGMEVQRADGFVVQTGDPDGPEDGFKDPATGEIRRWGACWCCDDGMGIGMGLGVEWPAS